MTAIDGIMTGLKVGFWVSLILGPIVFIEADKKRKQKNGDTESLKSKGYFPKV